MNFKPVMIKLSELEEHPLNPNVEDPNVFTNLVKEIEQDGFSEPITVVQNEKTGKYVVVSGNHRLKAAKVLCYDELPCIVQDWDEETQKIKIVRRNLLKGELDSTKFSKLVDSLENNYSPEELSKAMGFVSEDDFSRLYNLEQEMASRTAGAIAAQEAASSETAAIDGLSLLLNQLFSQYGATLVHSFMNFMYGKKLHTMLLMNTSLKKSLEKLALISSKHGLDMNELLSATIVEGSKALDIDKTPDLAKIESLRDVEEDYEYKHVDELEE